MQKSAIKTLILLTLCGCSRGITVTELSPTEQRLQYIAMAYQQAATDLGRGPPGMDEFRDYVAAYGNPEELLISADDGQPFQIVWNINTENLRRDEMPVIAYETAGTEGVHKGVDFQLAIIELSDQQVEQISLN